MSEEKLIKILNRGARKHTLFAYINGAKVEYTLHQNETCDVDQVTWDLLKSDPELVDTAQWSPPVPEVDALRKENETLKKEIADLKKQVADLEKL
jgi:hypothetical protein